MSRKWRGELLHESVGDVDHRVGAEKRIKFKREVRISLATVRVEAGQDDYSRLCSVGQKSN